MAMGFGMARVGERILLHGIERLKTLSEARK
jgi:hypothetical protein